MNIDDANKRVSHLVFYAQSTIAVISGRGNKPNSINMLLTAVKHNLFIFVENALVIKLPKRFRVQGLDWSLIVKPWRPQALWQSACHPSQTRDSVDNESGKTRFV